MWVKVILTIFGVPGALAMLYVWFKPEAPLQGMVIQDPDGAWVTAVSPPFALSSTQPIQNNRDVSVPTIGPSALVTIEREASASSSMRIYIVAVLPEADPIIRPDAFCIEGETPKAIYQYGLEIWRTKSLEDDFVCYSTRHNGIVSIMRTKNEDKAESLQLMGQFAGQIRRPQK